jgi:tRNA dimethylallyltransferase
MSVAVNMSHPEKKLPLVLIAGPTASGKSALALALAKMTPALIINADASQVYRDLRIVSARPSQAEEHAAPHQLFGHIDGAIACSAAHWAQDAKAAIQKAHQDRTLPILVGGTGLYIRTLLDGIAPVPEIDPAIRKQVRALHVIEAHAALKHEDEQAATRLSPADTNRVARALEVIRSTGRTLMDWQSEKSGGIADAIRLIPMILLPPREWLFARCDARFDMMLASGGFEEVTALLSRGLAPALPIMRAIGVREIAAIMADPENTAMYQNAAKIATRQYAKRQFTWFRNQLPVDWNRCDQQLDDEIVNNLAIKLRDIALTD